MWFQQESPNQWKQVDSAKNTWGPSVQKVYILNKIIKLQIWQI